MLVLQLKGVNADILVASLVAYSYLQEFHLDSTKFKEKHTIILHKDLWHTV